MASMPSSKSQTAAIEQQERMAREYLAQGRLRKARDEFKLLCKVDRARYLPLLVETNVQLTREMFSKGMVGEARQMVEYLKTIAAPEQVLALELEMGLKPTATAPGGVVGLILQTLARSSLNGEERRRLADQAVLTFETIPEPSSELAPLVSELDKISAGLRAVCEKEFSKAIELLRPVGQASVFSHWKQFIKGLCAFYAGDSEKAKRCFEAVPAASTPGRTSRGYLLLLGAMPSTQASPLPAEAVIETACQVVGSPGFGGPLYRAEQEWRTGKVAKMYYHLRKGPGFPSEGVSLAGLLSEFASNCFLVCPTISGVIMCNWLSKLQVDHAVISTR